MTTEHIFIHGIYQRSGTNHLLHLLSKHPEIHVFPHGVWEFPWLALADDLVAFDKRFTGHPKVRDLPPGALLPAFGDGVLAVLNRGEASEARLALKYPSVENLDRFFDFFPGHRLIIVVRDGRDVACSAMKTAFARPPAAKIGHPGTWRYALHDPHVVLARRWKQASRSIRSFLSQLEGTTIQQRVDVVRYEDLVQHRSRVLTGLIQRLGLTVASYPWAEIDGEPVRGSSFVGASADGQLDWRPTTIDVAQFSPIGRWSAWSERVRNRYEREAADELSMWGYGDVLREVDDSLRAYVL